MQPSVPVHANSRERRALLIAILAIAVLGLGAYCYWYFVGAPAKEARDRQAILDSVSSQSAQIQTTEAQRSAILQQVDAGTKPALTEQQKADILSSVSTH